MDSTDITDEVVILDPAQDNTDEDILDLAQDNTDEHILDPAEYLLKNTKYHNLDFSVGLPGSDSGYENIGAVSLPLIAHSTWFRSILTEEERGYPLCYATKIREVRPEVFKLILRHVYGGQLPHMSRDTAAELLLGADKFNIQPLVQRASVLLQPSSVEDVFPALRCVLYIKNGDIPELTAEVTNIVQQKTDELIKCDQFKQLDITCLEFITKQETLAISEVELWECLVVWAKNQHPDCRFDHKSRNLMHIALKHVRFLTMSIDDFAKNVVPHKILEPEEVVDIISAINNRELESSFLCNIREKRKRSTPDPWDLYD